jgi:hypothetical protein
MHCEAGHFVVLEVPRRAAITASFRSAGQVKTLHLYEARYLALLDEALARKPQTFCHSVIETVIGLHSLTPGAHARGGIVFCFPCLVRILKVNHENGTCIGILARTSGAREALVKVRKVPWTQLTA